MLNFSDIKTDLMNMLGSQSNTARADVTRAVKLAVQRAQEKFCMAYDWGFLEQLQDRVYIPLAAPYDTGTVDITQDNKTITGTGTTWTKDMEGSFFQVGSNEFYEIRTFSSTTSMILTIPYQNDTDTGEEYTIYKRFYPLPLNYLRPSARDAKLTIPGSNSENLIAYSRDASFADEIVEGQPTWFGIVGNTRANDYYNTSTVTVATSGTTSTWTVASGTLPTDIVDREVRIDGESNGYYIQTRSSATQFVTYNVYQNPSDGTNTQATASNFAITPKETQLIGFSHVPDQRYIMWLPYIKKPDDLIADTDVSIIVQAGYSDAFIAMCRRILAEDGRVALRADMVANLINASKDALDAAWASEQHAETMKMQGAVRILPRRQIGPSWISR